MQNLRITLLLWDNRRPVNQQKIPTVNGIWLKSISVALMTVATLVGATYANRTFLDPRPDAVTKTQVEVIRLSLEKDFDHKLRVIYQMIAEMRRDMEDADREIQLDKPPDWTKQRIKDLEKAMKKVVPEFEHGDEWGPR